MKKTCNKCGIEKDAVRDFYVSNRRGCCKSCMPMNQKVEHGCIDCGRIRLVTKMNVKLSNGRCRFCAQKIEKNKPEVLASLAIRAREQVLKQGGVPNAKKFTKERAGSNHHNWKGGITPEVLRIRNSEETRIWRKNVFERDDYTCQECGQVGGKLCAHHLKEFAKYPELRTDISNGQTLCYNCHYKTHNYGRRKKTS